MAKKIPDEVYARQIAKYPTEWQIVKDSVIVIKLSCEEKRVTPFYATLSAYELDSPENYVKLNPKSHGGKIDTIVNIHKVKNVAHLFFLNLNTYKQEFGEAQLGVNYIGLRLIRDGIVPRTLAQREIEHNGSA